MAQGTSQRGPSGSREQPEPAQATLGGTGYNCPPLKLNYQKQSRIVEATATLKGISSRLASKWQQSYSKTCGYVKSTIEITLVRSTHRCIRGSRMPAHKISVHRPQWEDGAGLSLFR